VGTEGTIMSFEDFQVGAQSSFSKTVTDADVSIFAGISGDLNPLHIDSEYAARTRFGQRLVHGALSSAFISASLTRLGIGHVYISQEVRFRKPLFIGDTVTATSEIVEKLPDKQRLRVKTTCTNQEGEAVTVGEAVLQCMPELFGGA
jgi:3-hydroxybutyryl-CoA dehydratase